MIEMVIAAAEGQGIGWLGIPAGGVGTAVLIYGANKLLRRGATITIPGEDGKSPCENDADDERVCPAHATVMKLLDERKTATDIEIRDIKDAIKSLDDRTDKRMGRLESKVDEGFTAVLKAISGRNGQKG